MDRRRDRLAGDRNRGSPGRGKKRPVVVVQADTYNMRLHHAVVAQVTTNLDERGDPAYLLIETSTPQGKQAGLDHDCLVSCTMLSLMSEDRLQEKIGKLSTEMLARLDGCLKAALGIG